MAVASVVLEIGSQMGPGGFASLESAINLTGRLLSTVSDFAEKQDALMVALKNTNMEMLNFANATAKGQIQAMNLADSIGSLWTAGITPTKDQLAALIQGADDFSDRTGQNMQEVFNQLTDAVIRGNERGMVPFGISVEETSDKAKAQQEILQKLTEKYGSSVVEIDSMSDAITSVKNNLTLLEGVIWEAINQGEGPFASMLSTISNGIADVSKKISGLSDAQKSYFFGLRSIADETVLAWGDVVKFFSGQDFNNIVDKAQWIAMNRLQENLTGTGSAAVTPGELARKGASAVDIRTAKKSGGGSKAPATMEFTTEELYDPYQYNTTSSDTYERAGASVDYRIQQEKELQDILDARLEAMFKERDAVYALEEAEGHRGLARIHQIHDIEDAERAYNASYEGRTKRAVKVTESFENSWDQVKSTFSRVEQAFEEGTKNMTAAQAAFYYIDCIIGAAVEVAKAAASYPDFLGMATHAVAAAGYVAAAAIAAANGGASGSSSASTSSVSSGYATAASAGSYTGGYSSDRSSEVNIHVTMDDSSKAFGLMVKENKKASLAGDPRFKMEAA